MIVELFGSPGSGKSTFVHSIESSNLTLQRKSKFNYIFADNLPSSLLIKIIVFFTFILHHPIILLKLVRVTNGIKFSNRLLLIMVFSRLYQGIFNKNSDRIDIFDQNISQWVWSLLYRRDSDKNNYYIVIFLKYLYKRIGRRCVFISIEVELLDLIKRLKSRKNGQSPIESGNVESVERSVKCHMDTLNIIKSLCSTSNKLYLIQVTSCKDKIINKTIDKILMFCENSSTDKDWSCF